MNLLWFLIVGLVAGWLAGVLVKGGGFGLIGDLVVGVIGAILGGWLFSAFGASAGGGLVGSIIVATIGAVVLLLIVRLVKRAWGSTVGTELADYSGLTPAALMTRSQRSRSFASQARNSAGVLPPSVMAPSLLSLSRVSRLASDARIDSCSRPTTAVGRPAGPTTPKPCVYCSNPGKPFSDIVGTF